MSLTARILLGFLTIAIIGLLVLVNPILNRVERQYLEAAEEPMVDFAYILADLLRDELSEPSPNFNKLEAAITRAHTRQPDARIYNLHKNNIESDITVTAADGRTLFSSYDQHTQLPKPTHHVGISRALAGQYGAHWTAGSTSDTSASIMHISAPVVAADGTIAAAVTISKPMKNMTLFIKETRAKVRRFGFAAVAFIAIIGYTLSRWVSAPLRTMTRHAEAIARGERVSLPPIPGKHLRTLGQTIENMRDALEGRKYVESYVQTLTHEMKSPVAAIRGAAELLEEPMPAAQQQRFVENIRMEGQRLQNLIDQLLALANLETIKHLDNRQNVNPADIIDRVFSEQQAAANTANVTLTAAVEPDLQIACEPFLLTMAISSLVQNAIEFSPAGSEVLATASRNHNNHIVFTINDHGKGIPDYAKPKIFQRFFSLPRPTTGRKSSGLGLCLARETAELHGGTIEISNNSPHGTTARLTLPA